MMKEMNENSIDLIYADPPFNTGIDWGEFDDRWTADNPGLFDDGWDDEVSRLAGKFHSKSMANYIEFMMQLEAKKEQDTQPRSH